MDTNQATITYRKTRCREHVRGRCRLRSCSGRWLPTRLIPIAVAQLWPSPQGTCVAGPLRGWCLTLALVRRWNYVLINMARLTNTAGDTCPSSCWTWWSPKQLTRSSCEKGQQLISKAVPKLGWQGHLGKVRWELLLKR